MGLRKVITGRARPAKPSPGRPKRSAARGVATAPSTGAPDALTRSLATAAEAAGSERLLAVEHAADRLSRYLREHRALLVAVGPIILAGTAKAPQLVLERDGTFRIRSVDARRKVTLERARAAEVVELWAPADLYDRIESAFRRAAGLATRPTGATIAGLGVAGDRGAKV